jgi:hypothetical protein
MVEVTRVRLVGLVEWAIAASAVAGVLGAGAVIYGDLRSVKPVVRAIAGAAARPVIPAGLRSGAVSVPLLVLPDNSTLKVGAPASALEVLGAAALAAPVAFERTDEGPRESRSYRYAGMDFVVVVAADKIVSIFR